MPPSPQPDRGYALWQWETAATALILAGITYFVSRSPIIYFPLHQVQTQDVVPLFVLSFSMIVVAFWTPAWRIPERLPRSRTLWLIGAVIAILLAAGSYWLMQGFPLSVDERMVLFDMAVFDRMQLAAPVAPIWQPYARALVPAFLLNDNMPTGLVSSYLPVNAMLRLVFSKLADPALFNPLLALVGGAALLDIAKREFKADGAACFVVLLTYALSAQMLVNAMTVYSMTPHMSLNLVWLAAFLRGRRLGHSTAILTGFVATGLHQLVFHPFFVAPFLLSRLSFRHWKLVMLYATAYALIILWWAYYPVLAGHAVANTEHPSQSSSLAMRISSAWAIRYSAPGFTMVLNLLRFFAWQNLALLPLLSASAGPAIRRHGLSAVLLLGIIFWLAFITIVIPFQGHGWGFRYLNPFLGSFSLLAGYGYQELRSLSARKIDGLVLALSGVTLLVTIPLLVAAAGAFVEPYLGIERLVVSQRTPMVLIDTDARPEDARTGNAIENVRNLPDLSNRPLRFSSRDMTPDLLRSLCDRGKITLITLVDEHRAGLAVNLSDSGLRFPGLVSAIQAEKPQCFVSAAVPADEPK